MMTERLPEIGGERALTKNSDEENIERVNRHLKLVSRRTENSDVMPHKQKLELFSNTQQSLRAKAFNLQQLNQKSRNSATGFVVNGQA